MKTTLKEVFKNGDWIITKVIQGGKIHRIDAKRRFPIADENNFYSNWGNTDYLERLASEHYGKKLSEFKNYQY